RDHPDALRRAAAEPGRGRGAGPDGGRRLDALPAGRAPPPGPAARLGRAVMTPTTADDAREQRLADLLTALTERRRRGEAEGIEQLVRDNPDLAAELRQLWAAAQVVGAFGGSSRASGGREPSSSPLPRFGGEGPGVRESDLSPNEEPPHPQPL